MRAAVAILLTSVLAGCSPKGPVEESPAAGNPGEAASKFGDAAERPPVKGPSRSGAGPTTPVEIAPPPVKKSGLPTAKKQAPAPAAPRTSSGQGAPRDFSVNGKRIPAERVAELERQYGVRLMDGEYWYDPVSGAWGMWGGPCGGQILPGLDLGGPLPANASGGGTGMLTNVWVNGRELSPADVTALQRITPVYQGRYWVDAMGNGGWEGQPATFNLYALARQAGGGGGGGNNPWIHRSEATGIGAGGDGRTTYVMGKDWSVIVGE